MRGWEGGADKSLTARSLVVVASEMSGVGEVDLNSGQGIWQNNKVYIKPRHRSNETELLRLLLLEATVEEHNEDLYDVLQRLKSLTESNKLEDRNVYYFQQVATAIIKGKMRLFVQRVLMIRGKNSRVSKYDWMDYFSHQSPEISSPQFVDLSQQTTTDLMMDEEERDSDLNLIEQLAETQRDCKDYNEPSTRRNDDWIVSKMTVDSEEQAAGLPDGGPVGLGELASLTFQYPRISVPFGCTTSAK
ncbi:hypothetical protein PPACK8108_LOCUS9046 [Phakopsora pachyrhizi]|uniref:Uncharacterized protein n=1 Tax=Phakopsora pachyrhizi TaxID=170000 RepID=A0AAV0AZ69_PHAPC|nr:hypothetical protein PPACK8108_LOCUS9046 [Phakopsora pachyrhizi]